MSDKLSSVQTTAATAVRTSRVYVDNSGKLYGATISAQTWRSLVSRGLVRVNGASRVMLDNGRTGRRIVLTIAGRTALGL